jgi:gas vesicle protein
MSRFVIGLLIGAGIGFAGVVLFAPAHRQAEERREPPAEAAGEEEATMMGRARELLRSARERVNEALSEAKEASREAEREMMAAYEGGVPREQTSERK